MNFKIIFKALTVIPLLVGSVNALYETVKSVDDDTDTVRILQAIQIIKVQVAVIKGYLKQLT